MSYDSEFDPSVPGGVYLCQVSEKISCGVCRGLYNVADASFDFRSELQHAEQLVNKLVNKLATETE